MTKNHETTMFDFQNKAGDFQNKAGDFQNKADDFQSLEARHRAGAMGRTHPYEGGVPFLLPWTLLPIPPTTKIEENLR